MGREPRVSAAIITAVQRITAKNNEERLTGNRLWGSKRWISGADCALQVL